MRLVRLVGRDSMYRLIASTMNKANKPSEKGAQGMEDVS